MKEFEEVFNVNIEVISCRNARQDSLKKVKQQEQILEGLKKENKLTNKAEMRLKFLEDAIPFQPFELEVIKTVRRKKRDGTYFTVKDIDIIKSEIELKEGQQRVYLKLKSYSVKGKNDVVYEGVSKLVVGGV
jgi:hypothetical protein